jgi:hypothetical protein
MNGRAANAIRRRAVGERACSRRFPVAGRDEAQKAQEIAAFQLWEGFHAPMPVFLFGVPPSGGRVSVIQTPTGNFTGENKGNGGAV